MSIMAPPGDYTVKLAVAGQEYSQPLKVLKDPNSPVTEQEIVAQTQFLQTLQRDVDQTVDMINQIEVVRAQLQQLGSLVGTSTDPNVKASDELRVNADSLEKKFIAVEEQLHQLRLTGRGQDGVRWPNKLAGKLLYLQGTTSADFAPTTQQRSVQEQLSTEVQTVKRQLEGLMQRELPAFNEFLRKRNVANIIALK